MNNNGSSGVMSALNGTRTQENLRRAFENDATSFARETLYADMAQNAGDASARRTLMEHADNDKRHAELWLGYLDELGDTVENLRELSALKGAMEQSLYAPMADIADEEGFREIAEKMRLAASVKNTHAAMLDREIQNLESDSPYSQEMTQWTCRSCGYSLYGNTPPETCPLCSYPRGYFDSEA